MVVGRLGVMREQWRSWLVVEVYVVLVRWSSDTCAGLLSIAKLYDVLYKYH